MCRPNSCGLKTAHMLIGPFMIYGHLNNFKISHKRKETLGSRLQNICLAAMDTFVWLNDDRSSNTIFS
jgi:hypothetical protein